MLLPVDTGTGLERMICFELYAASRAMTALYRPALDPAGLTYPQYLVMRVLWHRGATTVRDLGTALHLDSGTLSPLLKRLETAGLLLSLPAGVVFRFLPGGSVPIRCRQLPPPQDRGIRADGPRWCWLGRGLTLFLRPALPLSQRE